MPKPVPRVPAIARNRFVRFGYRRPPPWTQSTFDSHASRSSPPHLRNPHDHRSWPHIANIRLHIRELPSSQDPSVVPVVAHGIEAVLKGDGLYPLEAPWLLRKHRSSPRDSIFRKMRYYYRDSLRKIVQPENIAWWNIPGYVPAASDKNLHQTAAATPGALYSSSTSSITPAIAAMYHLLSNFRSTQLMGGLSAQVADLPNDFSKFHRRPVAFVVTRNDTDPTTYSVNAHEGVDTGPSILRDLGHTVERMLTTPPHEFVQKYVVQNERARLAEMGPSGEEEQFYHYSQISKFVLRAQIDCRNEATGEVFDVKTRAVAPIRYDLENYHAHTAHRLRYLWGKSDSYEREFYDMVRTVFLKYSLQLYIGRMSGALVAYHNTTEILGLEYISLEEIQSYVFGSQHWAETAFGTALTLLEEVLGEILGTVRLSRKEDKLKVVLATEWSQLRMYVFAQRITDDESDPLGCHEFAQELAAPRPRRDTHDGNIGDISGAGLWHVDSYLHNEARGISMVGSHPTISRLGGELVTKGALEPTRRRQTLDEKSFRDLAPGAATLNRDNFRMWELKVAPFVNDELVPKSAFAMDDGDSFHLKYDLTEVQHITNEHISKYLISLGRVYVK